MIHNGNQINLDENPGTLPNMEGTLLNWFQRVTFTVITKTVVNHVLTETETKTDFLGVIQPLDGKKLAMKPEGQRQWDWYMAHTTVDLDLAVDDKFIYRNVKYRIMAKKNYTEYGYRYYEWVEDFESP